VNFFTGKIFLGDGGAYLIGFLSASFSLIVAGPQINKVSPWLPIAVNAYPIIETLFSITRRCVNGVSPFHPDSNHLHTLCFRFFKKKLSRKFFSPSLLNSLSVLPITFSSAVLSFLAILYRKDSLVLVVLLISYGFLYLCFYSFLSKMARREKLI
jgi:UDP-N-acetylmuramyl pentapeptide phosphotransferase/UDP-N-acetylglucosamine-1-phosphate transferase